MKKQFIYVALLLISQFSYSQIIKSDIVLGTNEEGSAIRGIAKKVVPIDPTYGVFGFNLATNSNGYGVGGYSSGTGVGVSGFSQSGRGGYFSSTSGYALVTGSGFVGIGDDPEARLHVRSFESEKLRLENRSSLATNSETSMWFKNGNFFTGALKTIGKDGNEARMGLFTYSSSIQSNLEERLTILDGGKVGIGITTPNEILDINGRTRIRHLPDFTAGVWMSNSVNGLASGDGAFFGMNCATAASETAGIFIGGAWGMEIDRSGNMRVKGAITSSVGTITTCSDRRFKKDFTKIENPLLKITQIEGLHYYWRTDEFQDRGFTKDHQIGFIAQEIEKIFPEMVFTDEKGFKSVDYARLTPVLVEAMKELSKKVDDLRFTNDDLRLKNEKLESRLDKIEAILNK